MDYNNKKYNIYSPRWYRV